MKNGRADHDEDEEPNDPKIARIEDARRRRQLGQAQARRERIRQRIGGSARDWLIGGVIIAMALGFVVSWLWPILQSAGAVPR